VCVRCGVYFVGDVDLMVSGSDVSHLTYITITYSFLILSLLLFTRESHPPPKPMNTVFPRTLNRVRFILPG
jgi:hypothetical protein